MSRAPQVASITSIPTKEGVMIPVWRDWDSITPTGFVPRMVYVSTVNPGMDKGVIVHKERTSVMTVLGDRDLVVEVMSPEKDSLLYSHKGVDKLFLVTPGMGVRVRNHTKSPAEILVISDTAWKPGWDDSVRFKTWEEYQEWVRTLSP